MQVQSENSRAEIQFEILTLFPGLFSGFLAESILKRAQDRGLIRIGLHDFRKHASLPHRACDDSPYGGGGGMVLRPEPVFAAVEELLGQSSENEPGQCSETPVILLTPQGRVFNQRIANELSEMPRIVLICGRYEGVDERIRQGLVTDEISIGDYVLGGGEVAAMVVIEAVSRQVAGVLGYPSSHLQDSHSPEMDGLLEGPHYTRPADFRGMNVPKVLVSGHHAKVQQWRREQSLLRTAQRRPDLLRLAKLSDEDKKFLLIQGIDLTH